ncbi:hypothetical protein AXF42_Ash006809 [Apostasia shenzhenica]|uniref:Uncharacterized protein n=1 Tax=Apostasia shenzhenica TaxID=1088818 RepID=A0A2I0AJ78_9ASPA|nr:hypothetical protein AXF42_Ash006809 [Apostasia shenzhenica]
MEGTSKMWDVTPDTMSSVEDICMFEVTELSLDEPEFEVMLLDDDEEECDEKIGDEEDIYENI